MIDIEYQVIDGCRKYIEKTFPNINIPQEYIEETAIFPTITIVELNNTTNLSTKTSKQTNHINLIYQIDIYTTGQIKKTQSKQLKKLVDEYFNDYLGMNRIASEPIYNLEDMSIYRYVMRYTGILDLETLKIYRRN